MAYHYKESGLDNVFLENGYTVHKTSYGEGVSIKDTDGLHKLIGRWLVALPKRLNGAELRFLRLEMEMTQRSLASVLGQEEQAVRRWEKNRTRPINGSADHLLRILYSEYVDGNVDIRKAIDRLAELDQIEHAEARLCAADDHWSMAA